MSKAKSKKPTQEEYLDAFKHIELSTASLILISRIVCCELYSCEEDDISPEDALSRVNKNVTEAMNNAIEAASHNFIVFDENAAGEDANKIRIDYDGSTLELQNDFEAEIQFHLAMLAEMKFLGLSENYGLGRASFECMAARMLSQTLQEDPGFGKIMSMYLDSDAVAKDALDTVPLSGSTPS